MELNLSQLATQIAAAILFLVPGLNATWTIERFSGPSRLKGTERFLRAVSLSVLIYAFASPWLLRVGRRAIDANELWPWEPIIGAGILLFVAPVILALIVAFLRRNDRAKRLLHHVTTIDPTPRAWDFAFKPGGPFYVRIKLRDGERVGGFFSNQSFASAYPESEGVFLEQAWRLDNDGSFIEPLPGTGGVLVPQESIQLVELLAPQEVAGHG